MRTGNDPFYSVPYEAAHLSQILAVTYRVRTRSRPTRDASDRGTPMASSTGLLDGALLRNGWLLCGLPTGAQLFWGLASAGACLVLALPTGAQLGTLGLG